MYLSLAGKNQNRFRFENDPLLQDTKRCKKKRRSKADGCKSENEWWKGNERRSMQGRTVMAEDKVKNCGNISLQIS